MHFLTLLVESFDAILLGVCADSKLGKRMLDLCNMAVKGYFYSSICTGELHTSWQLALFYMIDVVYEVKSSISLIGMSADETPEISRFIVNSIFVLLV